MRNNRDTKTYPGGILNRINHITFRTGESVVASQDLTANQNIGAHLQIARTSRPAEQPVERTLQDGKKDTEV